MDEKGEKPSSVVTCNGPKKLGGWGRFKAKTTESPAPPLDPLRKVEERTGSASESILEETCETSESKPVISNKLSTSLDVKNLLAKRRESYSKCDERRGSNEQRRGSNSKLDDQRRGSSSRADDQRRNSTRSVELQRCNSKEPSVETERIIHSLSELKVSVSGFLNILQINFTFSVFLVSSIYP